MARTTVNQVLALVNSKTEHAKELCSLIQTLNKGLQITITEKEIGDHINAQFRKYVAKKSSQAATNNRKQLSKARVITSEDVKRLRKIREEADSKKFMKAAARETKKKLKEFIGSPKP